VETPTGRFKKLVLPNPDTEVWVAINTEGVTVIDRTHCDLLLSVPFTQLSWEFRDPDFDGDNDPPPCLYLQVYVVIFIVFRLCFHILKYESLAKKTFLGVNKGASAIK
jgi:hypothetical protein